MKTTWWTHSVEQRRSSCLRFLAAGAQRGAWRWAAALAAVHLLACPAPAQIVVPPGFDVVRIMDPLDDGIPQLSAIDSPEFGQGVLTASAGNGVVSFRRVTPTGDVFPLATHTDNASWLEVLRVRWDADGVLDGLVHATIGRGDVESQETVYLTIDPQGNVSEKWSHGDGDDPIAYDFEITPGGTGFPIGATLLDINLEGGGTALAAMDTNFTVTVLESNSHPPGRSDTDVRGFRRDVTGLYGGGILLADTDANTDQKTALYELRDVLGGGQYRLIGSEVSHHSRYYGDLAVSSTGVFGQVAYITDDVSEEIQQVDPAGTHTTWATGFNEVDSLAISHDGASMYVADSTGLYLIRESGTEPGPVVLCHSPSTPERSPMTRDPVVSFRVLFSEPVSFTPSDIAITNDQGQAVGFLASNSGTKSMLVDLAAPLFDDTYTVTLLDSIHSVAAGTALDGDRDGAAGGHFQFQLAHLAEWPPTQIMINSASMVEGNARLEWVPNRTGLTYLVESSVDPELTTWETAAPTTQWWTTETSWTDSSGTEPPAGFRVRGRR